MPRALVRAAGLDGPLRGTFRPDSAMGEHPLLVGADLLHLNQPRGHRTYIADGFAIALILLAMRVRRPDRARVVMRAEVVSPIRGFPQVGAGDRRPIIVHQGGDTGMKSRREFLATSAALGAGLGLVGCAAPDRGQPAEGGTTPGGRTWPGIETASRPLDILVLGGTGFLGPAEVEYALARGHRLALFNRGRTNPDLFPGVERLVGDRAAPDYSALEGRTWDAVIDNSANVASWVRDSAEVLRGSVDRYLFVSSISAHSDNSILGQGESGPVFTREDYDEAVASGADFGSAFGPNKAEAERITLETFGDGGLVVRPGLIVGPGDRSDRFTYWPVRIDRGGEVVAPGDGTDLAQIIDVRDLGRFIVHLVEQEASGTYLATGPESELTMAGMLHGIRAVTSANVKLTWIPADFLREHEVGAWMEMPVWVYPSPEMSGFSAYDCSKAIAAGLTFRPLADTARDTLDWWRARPQEERTLRTGLAPEKEAAILAAWHARSA